MSGVERVKWMGRLHRMGGSIGVIVPKALREELGMKQGDYMAILVFGQTLVMRPILKAEVLDRDHVPVTALQSAPRQDGNDA